LPARVSISITLRGGLSIDAQHFLKAGQEEQQSHGWHMRDVGQRIQPVVTRPVGQGQMRIAPLDGSL